MSFPIIISTYHKMEPFIEPSLVFMNETWKSHGNVLIISDDRNSGNFNNTLDTYRYDNKLTWLTGLHRGLTYYKKKYPEINIIYFLLEDLVPLRKIDLDTLTNNEQTFQSLEWNCLYFPHYENMFSFEIKHNGELYAETPPDFLFYSQIGASLYKLSYLIELCELAMDNSLESPWQFEALKSHKKHYVSSYHWPTVRDGYSKNRFINKDALSFFDKESSHLKKILTRAYYKQSLFKFYQIVVVQKFRNLINKLKHR